TDANNQLNGAFTVGRNSDSSLYVVNQSAVDVSSLSDANKALFNAITDTSQTATVNIVGNTGQSDFGDHISPGVNTVDMGNLAHLGDPSNAGGLTPGGALAHEMMDAWYSLSQPDTPAGQAAADQQAAALFPGLIKPTSKDTRYDISSGSLNGQTALQRISNGSGAERITIKYAKPVSLATPPGQLQRAMTNAGSRVTGVTFVP